MPTYTCPKCARVFKQKSGFTDHQNKKTDCATVMDKDTMLRQAVTSRPEVTKETSKEFYEDLHNLLWNKAGLNPEAALEHMTFFFAYRMIEPQVDTLGLPQECRWSYVAGIRDANDLCATIMKGTTAFRKNASTKQFFKPQEIQKAEVVFDIVQHVNRLSMKTLQENDTLGDIFEYMLERGMSTMSDEGQYFTNTQICRLAFKLAYGIKKQLRRPDGSLCTFGDWFCGTGGFAAQYVRGLNANLKDINWSKDASSIYCQDMNIRSVTTTLLNMLILTGTPFSGDNIRSGNSFYDPVTLGVGAPFSGVTLDYCFMNPPYGGDKTKAKEYKFAYTRKVKTETGTEKRVLVNQDIQSVGIEDDDKVSAGVQLAMATLSADGGVCCIVLPQGFFFGASKKLVELRKRIAEQYKVYYVVDIASGAFVNTGTKTSMLVFQRGVGPTETVKFIGMDETLLAEASLAGLRGKNYMLNYKQYIPQTVAAVQGFNIVTLEDVCEFKRGQMITKDSLKAGSVPVIGGGLSPMGYHDKSNRDAYTILVSQSGENAGHISRYNVPVWASDCFSIKSKVDTIDDSYLFYILKSIQSEISSLKVGTAQPHVYPSTIAQLQIRVPSLEHQKKIVAAIDGWASAAQQEEALVKLLEQQAMREVEELCAGKTSNSLGSICEIKTGKALTKDNLIDGDIPVVGGGLSPIGYHTVHTHDAFTPILAQVGANAGNVSRSPTKCWVTNNGMTVTPNTKFVSNDILYYILKNIQSTIRSHAEGTAQPKLSALSVLSIEVQVPTLEDQKSLQPLFDEIRHKHQMISFYKNKAQTAIDIYIPKPVT